ncbi:MAG: helix-turn-helix transcriptional regulator [Coriobacteriia bacterium]|nr:helix-turn-helix transcriptional regulator [Coriobacteriia bacterium]MBS5477690.1 helix-turn-helix transcriptional regulator [Coriobacteriia bacterium]
MAWMRRVAGVVWGHRLEALCCLWFSVVTAMPHLSRSEFLLFFSPRSADGTFSWSSGTVSFGATYGFVFLGLLAGLWVASLPPVSMTLRTGRVLRRTLWVVGVLTTALFVGDVLGADVPIRELAYAWGLVPSPGTGLWPAGIPAWYLGYSMVTAWIGQHRALLVAVSGFACGACGWAIATRRADSGAQRPGVAGHASAWLGMVELASLLMGLTRAYAGALLLPHPAFPLPLMGADKMLRPEYAWVDPTLAFAWVPFALALAVAGTLMAVLSSGCQGHGAHADGSAAILYPERILLAVLVPTGAGELIFRLAGRLYPPALGIGQGVAIVSLVLYVGAAAALIVLLARNLGSARVACREARCDGAGRGGQSSVDDVSDGLADRGVTPPAAGGAGLDLEVPGGGAVGEAGIAGSVGSAASGNKGCSPYASARWMGAVASLGDGSDLVRETTEPASRPEAETAGDVRALLADALPYAALARLTAWGLTDNEINAVRARVVGLTSRQASDALGIQPSTVRAYGRRACTKAGVATLDELVAALGVECRALESAADLRVFELAAGAEEAGANVPERSSAAMPGTRQDDRARDAAGLDDNGRFGLGGGTRCALAQAARVSGVAGVGIVGLLTLLPYGVIASAWGMVWETAFGVGLGLLLWFACSRFALRRRNTGGLPAWLGAVVLSALLVASTFALVWCQGRPGDLGNVFGGRSGGWALVVGSTALVATCLLAALDWLAGWWVSTRSFEAVQGVRVARNSGERAPVRPAPEDAAECEGAGDAADDPSRPCASRAGHPSRTEADGEDPAGTDAPRLPRFPRAQGRFGALGSGHPIGVNGASPCSRSVCLRGRLDALLSNVRVGLSEALVLVLIGAAGTLATCGPAVRKTLIGVALGMVVIGLFGASRGGERRASGPVARALARPVSGGLGCMTLALAAVLPLAWEELWRGRTFASLEVPCAYFVLVLAVFGVGWLWAVRPKARLACVVAAAFGVGIAALEGTLFGLVAGGALLCLVTLLIPGCVSAPEKTDGLGSEQRAWAWHAPVLMLSAGCFAAVYAANVYGTALFRQGSGAVFGGQEGYALFVGTIVGICLVVLALGWIAACVLRECDARAVRLAPTPSQATRLRGYLVGRGLRELEVDVALLTASGASAAQVAQSLSYARSSVASARREAYRKLGVHSREQLVTVLQAVLAA